MVRIESLDPEFEALGLQAWILRLGPLILRLRAWLLRFKNLSPQTKGTDAARIQLAQALTSDVRALGGFITACSISPYLLGLLAMIKCSICSYQCDN